MVKKNKNNEIIYFIYKKREKKKPNKKKITKKKREYIYRKYGKNDIKKNGYKAHTPPHTRKAVQKRGSGA